MRRDDVCLHYLVCTRSNSKQYHIYSNMRVDADRCVSDGSEEKPHPIFIVDTTGKSEECNYLVTRRQYINIILCWRRSFQVFMKIIRSQFVMEDEGNDSFKHLVLHSPGLYSVSLQSHGSIFRVTLRVLCDREAPFFLTGFSIFA